MLSTHMRPETITLLDVARHAGVSRATASLVLRGSDLVSDETRARVQASMHNLGYVYNRAAASLRTQRSQTVGLIVPDVTNPYFAEMTVGIEAHLDTVQHVALLGNTSETLSKQTRLLATMQEYRADGILLCVSTGTQPQTITELRRWQMPFVLFARYVEGVEADYVGADNVTGADMATSHLVALGHRRIAFVGGPLDSSARRDRVRGYLHALQRHGIAPDPVLQTVSPTTRDAGYKAVRTMLAQPDPPSAIVCYNDVVAFGVMLGGQAAGRTPGRDLAVVGFDDIAESALWQPALTTIAVAPRRIGEDAATLLLERIAHPDAPSRRIIAPPQLVVRDSTNPYLSP